MFSKLSRFVCAHWLRIGVVVVWWCRCICTERLITDDLDSSTAGRKAQWESSCQHSNQDMRASNRFPIFSRCTINKLTRFHNHQKQQLPNDTLSSKRQYVYGIEQQCFWEPVACPRQVMSTKTFRFQHKSFGAHISVEIDEILGQTSTCAPSHHMLPCSIFDIAAWKIELAQAIFVLHRLKDNGPPKHKSYTIHLKDILAPNGAIVSRVRTIPFA